MQAMVTSFSRRGTGYLAWWAPGGGYLWMVILALWGGTASYLSRLKQNQALTFSLAELAGEWAISGFAGLLMPTSVPRCT